MEFYLTGFLQVYIYKIQTVAHLTPELMFCYS